MMYREFILKYEANRTPRNILLATPITKSDEVNISYEELENNTEEFKKRSKIIDYKDTGNKKNLIIQVNGTKPNGTSYFGHQLIEDETNFIFINTGKEFKVLPVREFYKFSMLFKDSTVSNHEKNEINEDQYFLEEPKKEIRVEDKEEMNEYNVFVEEEKKRLQQNRKKKTEFTEELLRNMILDKEISVKDLLVDVKKSFKLDERVKKLIQSFVKQNCVLNSEKKLVLKSK